MQSDPSFQALNVAFVSIAFDSQEELSAAKQEYEIVDVPLLTDANQQVSTDYDVLKWAVGTGEPGHTFILVDATGEVVWIRDYGSPTLPNPVMYVEPQELIDQINTALNN